MHQKVKRICGGCGSEIEKLGQGDIWIPELGSVQLCLGCINIIRVALPVLNLTIKIRKEEYAKTAERWNNTQDYKSPERKFILLIRPKEKF